MAMDGSLVTNSSLGDSTLTTDISSYTTDILDADQNSFCNGDFATPCLTTTDDLIANGLYCDGVIMNVAVNGIPLSKTLDSVADEDDDDIDDEPCGWGPVQPKCCQQFRNAKMVLVCLCLLAIIQGMVVNGFVSVVISTIEKRFDLTSTQSGFIASGYDIASVLCLIPVSYFGGNGNKPRWIVGGIFLLSLGSFLFALPHFLVDLYTYDITGRQPTCHIDDTNGSGTTRSLFSGNTTSGVGECQESGATAPPLSHYMYVMVIAQMLHGAGATPIYTLAVTYLDENLKAKLTPMYLGVFYSTAIIGPAIGYILGGQLLKLYCDVGWVDMNKINLNPEDPQWVGAWWIGFLISGTLAFLLALPLSGFPKSLPGSEKLRAERVSEVYKGSDTSSSSPNAGFSLSLKDISASLKILFKNPTFMCLNFAGACEGLLVSGFIVFAPKFVESQFSISAAWAAQLIGFATIPSGGGGTFFGGYLVKRLNLRCVGILRLCIITTFTSLLLTLCMLARCPDMGFVGVNLEYSQRNRTLEQVNLTASCNAGCFCSSERYSPVCGSDKLTYFSPCHAGCSSVGSADGVKVYEDCSCISSMLAEDGLMRNATALDGKCEGSCQLLTIFLPIFAMIIFVTFITSMPALSATLRCVPEKQRSFALGIQWMLFRCLGMIPAPVLFGSLIDRACLAWQQQPCLSENGSCFTYDNWTMGTYFLTLIFCCKGLSLLFFFIALFLYRPPPTTNANVATVVEVHNNGSVPNDAWGSTPSSLRLLDSNGICDTEKIYSGPEKMKNGTTV